LLAETGELYDVSKTMFTDNVNDPATIVYPIIVLINIEENVVVSFFMILINLF